MNAPELREFDISCATWCPPETRLGGMPCTAACYDLGPLWPTDGQFTSIKREVEA